MVDLIDGSKAYALAVIEHATRRVRVLGTTMHPTSDWVVQQARNLVMDLEDAGLRAKFLIHDRDASFGAAFDAVLTAAGTEVIRTGIRAPRQNLIMERWVPKPSRGAHRPHPHLKPAHLMRLLREYENHYNPHLSWSETRPTGLTSGDPVA